MLLMVYVSPLTAKERLKFSVGCSNMPIIEMEVSLKLPPVPVECIAPKSAEKLNGEPLPAVMPFSYRRFPSICLGLNVSYKEELVPPEVVNFVSSTMLAALALAIEIQKKPSKIVRDNFIL